LGLLFTSRNMTSTQEQLAKPVGTTLERYIMHKQVKFPYTTGELSYLLRGLTLAASQPFIAMSGYERLIF